MQFRTFFLWFSFLTVNQFMYTMTAEDSWINFQSNLGIPQTPNSIIYGPGFTALHDSDIDFFYDNNEIPQTPNPEQFPKIATYKKITQNQIVLKKESSNALCQESTFAFVCNFFYSCLDNNSLFKPEEIPLKKIKNQKLSPLCQQLIRKNATNYVSQSK